VWGFPETRCRAAGMRSKAEVSVIRCWQAAGDPKETFAELRRKAWSNMRACLRRSQGDSNS